jgi:hypothetical protein
MLAIQVSEEVMSNPTALDCLMNMGDTSENVSSEYISFVSLIQVAH